MVTRLETVEEYAEEIARNVLATEIRVERATEVVVFTFDSETFRLVSRRVVPR